MQARYSPPPPLYLPTPAELARVRDAIRAGWSEATTRKRGAWMLPLPLTARPVKVAVRGVEPHH